MICFYTDPEDLTPAMPLSYICQVVLALICHGPAPVQDPIPERIHSGLAQKRSCDPDRPIAFHKSFTGKFIIELTWSWLNEKHQTDDIYPWRHNWKCGDVIYECRYESAMASSVHAHSVCSRYNTVWTCHIRQVCFLWLTSLKINKLLIQDRQYSSKCFPVVCRF